MSSYNSGNSNSHGRGGGGGGGGMPGGYNNRYARDSSGGHFSGNRDQNYGRRDRDGHRPYHSHTGGQSGDTSGAEWSKPLPANPTLER